LGNRWARGLIEAVIRGYEKKQKRKRRKTHTRLTVLLPGLPGWAGTSKLKTNLDFTEARDSEWQWHQQGICKSAPRSRQTTTPAPHHSTSFLQAGCPSCRPTNSFKALKAKEKEENNNIKEKEERHRQRGDGENLGL